MIAHMYSDERTCTTINNAVNISMTLVCAASTGLTGVAGPQGPEGPAGPRGNAGPPGV